MTMICEDFRAEDFLTVCSNSRVACDDRVKLRAYSGLMRLCSRTRVC